MTEEKPSIPDAHGQKDRLPPSRGSRKARQAVKENPLTTLGVAAAAGFLLATLLRR